MSEKRLIATGAVVRCPRCGGVGWVPATDANGYWTRTQTCPRCFGEGNIVHFEAYEREKV